MSRMELSDDGSRILGPLQGSIAHNQARIGNFVPCVKQGQIQGKLLSTAETISNSAHRFLV